MNKESLSSDKIESIAERFVTESSLIMNYESRSYEEQNENLNVLENIVWPSSTIKNRSHNQYEFDYDKTNNIQMDQLKLRRLQNRIDIEKFYDGKFKAKLEKLPLKTITSFKRNFSQKTISNNTIYLYENQTSKCVN